MSDNGPPPALCRAYDRAMARFDVSQCSVLDVMSGVPLYPPVLCVRFAQSKKWKALERWAAARYLKACPGKYMTHTYKPSWRPCGELTLASFITRSEKESMFVLDTPPPSSLASDIGTWPKPAQGASGHGVKMDSFFVLYSKSTCVVDREAASQDTWMVQLVGEKRVMLAPPWLAPHDADLLFSSDDTALPGLVEVTLLPGDALHIPAGTHYSVSCRGPCASVARSTPRVLGIVPCPFPGCLHVGPMREMEMHARTCSNNPRNQRRRKSRHGTQRRAGSRSVHNTVETDMDCDCNGLEQAVTTKRKRVNGKPEKEAASAVKANAKVKCKGKGKAKAKVKGKIAVDKYCQDGDDDDDEDNDGGDGDDDDDNGVLDGGIEVGESDDGRDEGIMLNQRKKRPKMAPPPLFRPKARRGYRLMNERDPKVPAIVATDPQRWHDIDWVVESVVNHTLVMCLAFEVKWQDWGESWNDVLVAEGMGGCTAAISEYVRSIPCWGGGKSPKQFQFVPPENFRIVDVRKSRIGKAPAPLALPGRSMWFCERDTCTWWRGRFLSECTQKGTIMKRKAGQCAQWWRVRLHATIDEDGHAHTCRPEFRILKTKWMEAHEGTGWGILSDCDASMRNNSWLHESRQTLSANATPASGLAVAAVQDPQSSQQVSM